MPVALVLGPRGQGSRYSLPPGTCFDLHTFVEHDHAVIAHGIKINHPAALQASRDPRPRAATAQLQFRAGPWPQSRARFHEGATTADVDEDHGLAGSKHRARGKRRSAAGYAALKAPLDDLER